MADEKIGRAVLEIGTDTKDLKAGLEEVNKRLRGMQKETESIGSKLNLVVWQQFGEMAGRALSATIQKIGELAQRGSEVAGVKSGFDALSRSIEQSGDAMLGVTRSATKGLISDFDLMAASNKAMLLGLPVTAESMGTMAQTAVTLGRAMKMDATKSLDDLTTALGRGSPLILDNLGLTVKVGEANEAYARALGKSSKDLTEQEKKMAFYNAAMSAAKQKVAELGEVQLTFSEHLSVMRNRVQNLTDGLGMQIATSPVLAAGMKSIGDSIDAAFGGNQQDAIQIVADLINEAAILFVKAAQVGVEGARYIARAWSGLEVIFNALAAIQVKVWSGLVDIIASALELAQKIPGVGKSFDGASQFARALTTDLAELSTGFAAQADQALDKAAAQETAFDAASAALGRAAASMESAQGAATGTATAMSMVGEQTAAVAQRTEEDSKKIAEAQRKLLEEQQKISEIQVSIFGTPKMAAEAAAYEFGLLRAAITQAGASMATMSQGELLAMETQLVALEIATRADAVANDQVATALGNVRAQLFEMGVNVATASAQATAAYAGMSAGALSLQATTSAALNGIGTILTTVGNGPVKALGTTFGGVSNAISGHIKRMSAAAGQYGKDSAEMAAFASQSTWEMVGEVGGALAGLGKVFKAGAIAGAIISTYSGIAKAIATIPWPAVIPAVASVAAMGWANVNKIRGSGAGFKEGTDNLDFMAFGRQSLQPLHGNEAVVPQGKGHLLAREIAAAMPATAADEALLSAMNTLVDKFDSLPQMFSDKLRFAMQMSGG